MTRGQARAAILRVAYDRGLAHGKAGQNRVTETHNAGYLARYYALAAGITWTRKIVHEAQVTERYREGYVAGELERKSPPAHPPRKTKPAR